MKRFKTIKRHKKQLKVIDSTLAEMCSNSSDSEGSYDSFKSYDSFDEC